MTDPAVPPGPSPRPSEPPQDPPGEAPDGSPRCSAKGCRAEAFWALRWNNPRIHTPERRKIWTACDDHRAHLGDFLDRRGMLRDIVPITEVTEAP